MSYKPKVSIVVPIFNVEPFLEVCVDSLRQQTLADIEIILVDDGSPDRSGAIADSLAEQDSRIKVIHQDNQGLGPARNSGIAVATGEYVGFVDSDDWVDPDMYERLYSAAQVSGSDIVLTGLKTVHCGEVDKILRHPLAGETLIGQSEIYKIRSSSFGALPCKIKEDPIPVSVCVGIFKLSLLNDAGASFRAIRSEDIAFMIEAGRFANSITCVEGTPYCYRKDDQPSISKTFSVNTIDSFFELFELMLELADEEHDEYKTDSLLRVKRRIIDYSRVLIGMIEDASIPASQKREYTAMVLGSSYLHSSLVKFPCWKLPIAQMLFCFALKTGSSGLARSLVKLRRFVHAN